AAPKPAGYESDARPLPPVCRSRRHRVARFAPRLGHRRGVVVLVGDVLAPGGAVAFVVDLEHREVGHEAVGGGAVPVVFAGLEEDAVAGADDLDRGATALSAADAFEDVDGLPVGVGVPCGACARREVDAARAQLRPVRWRRNRVDVDRAGEPVARPGRGLDGVFRGLHGCPPVQRGTSLSVAARACGLTMLPTMLSAYRWYLARYAASSSSLTSSVSTRSTSLSTPPASMWASWRACAPRNQEDVRPLTERT